MIAFGFGRADISAFEPAMTMMGWGVRTNRALGVGVPLHARAVVIHDPGSGERVAFVALDTLLVTQGLWRGVLDALAGDTELRLDAHNVVLVATHTHSGPSGFGHHFWTNVNAPGFAPRVYDALREGVVRAIRHACGALVPGHATVAQAVVPLAEGVAFNRSWFAYNRNRDVEPVTEARRDEATDRITTTVRFRDLSGRLVGLLNWFGVHGTCVHADNTLLHPDHKGLAALALEAEGLGVVFAQECCGDVTPNFRYDRRRGHTVGRFDDDLASAAHVADAEARWALSPSDGGETPLDGPLEVRARYLDLSAAPIDARFAADPSARRTTPALLGVAMAMGTAEGPGPLRRAPWVARGLNALAGARDLLRRGRLRDPKFPLLDLGRGRDGRLAGLLPMAWTPPLDPTFRWVRDAVRRGGVHEGAWVPQVVPIHLVRLGALVIAATPFELTTVAGRRLRATIAEQLGDGVRHVVISPYANAYVGYLTTFEEYQVQHYEAGYTLFGPHTLAALRTAFAGLAATAATPRPPMGEPPRRPDPALLARIAFTAPYPD